MNSHNPDSTSPWFWPAFFFVLAFNCYLLFEVHSISLTTSSLTKEYGALVEQEKDLKNNLATARTINALTAGLAADVLTMGNDPEVAKIIEKRGIRRQ